MGWLRKIGGLVRGDLEFRLVDRRASAEATERFREEYEKTKKVLDEGITAIEEAELPEVQEDPETGERYVEIPVEIIDEYESVKTMRELDPFEEDPKYISEIIESATLDIAPGVRPHVIPFNRQDLESIVLLADSGLHRMGSYDYSNTDRAWTEARLIKARSMANHYLFYETGEIRLALAAYEDRMDVVEILRDEDPDITSISLGRAASIASEISDEFEDPVEKRYWMRQNYENSLEAANLATRSNPARAASYYRHAFTAARKLFDMTNEVDWLMRGQRAVEMSGYIEIGHNDLRRAINDISTAGKYAQQVYEKQAEPDDVWLEKSYQNKVLAATLLETFGGDNLMESRAGAIHRMASYDARTLWEETRSIEWAEKWFDSAENALQYPQTDRDRISLLIGHAIVSRDLYDATGDLYYLEVAYQDRVNAAEIYRRNKDGKRFPTLERAAEDAEAIWGKTGNEEWKKRAVEAYGVVYKSCVWRMDMRDRTRELKIKITSMGGRPSRL